MGDNAKDEWTCPHDLEKDHVMSGDDDNDKPPHPTWNEDAWADAMDEIPDELYAAEVIEVIEGGIAKERQERKDMRQMMDLDLFKKLSNDNGELPAIDFAMLNNTSIHP